MTLIEKIKDTLQDCIKREQTVFGGILDTEQGKAGFLLACRQMLHIIEADEVKQRDA